MTCIDNDPLYLKLSAALDSLCTRVDDIIAQQDKREEECKLNDELVTQFEQELRISRSLQAQYEESRRHEARLARVCGAGGAGAGAGAALADRDRARLEKAKEMYQIAKEFTGIRWDFSAPPDVAKGYVRSEARKLLEPFEFPCPAATASAASAGGETVSAALWALLAADKENLAPPRRAAPTAPTAPTD